MNVSVLIPSRARPEGLRRAIESVFATAAEPENVEALVRLDEDDPTNPVRTRLMVFGASPRVRAWVGPRLRGYASLNLLYTELTVMASGRWCWIMNDDAFIKGQPGWDLKLKEIVDEFCLVQPDCEKYGKYEGGPFPIFPVTAVKRIFDGQIFIGDPADTWLDQQIVKLRGGKTYYLDGTYVQHDRPSDEELAKHRA